jgi:hypothetical protein
MNSTETREERAARIKAMIDARWAGRMTDWTRPEYSGYRSYLAGVSADAAPPVRYCAGCNEIEGSSYAKHCCTDDNMLEA